MIKEQVASDEKEETDGCAPSSKIKDISIWGMVKQFAGKKITQTKLLQATSVACLMIMPCPILDKS